MTPVTRLVTLVDRDDGSTDPRTMSFSTVHLAVLHDGQRVTLLDDRGWSVSGPADLWQRMTVEEIADTARTVVGPDEPFGDHTPADMDSDHWAGLADTLGRHGVHVTGGELSRLPHDVEMSRRVRERLGRP